MSLSSKLGLDDVDVKGKRVFIRVDFNVPFDKEVCGMEMRGSLLKGNGGKKVQCASGVLGFVL